MGRENEREKQRQREKRQKQIFYIKKEINVLK